MKTKQARQLDEMIEDSYYRQSAGTQISVMDIPKLYNDVRAAVGAGGDLDAATLDAIRRYEVRP